MMVRRALRATVPPCWMTSDEVYGSDSKFRRFLDSEGLSYLVAVTSGRRVWVSLKQERVDSLPRGPYRRSWRRLSGAARTKGHRNYD
jgi:SRSO17 transposase